MTPGRGVRTLANQPRGFDRELTRDFAKRESVLRFEVERWRARAESLNEENEYIRASNEVVNDATRTRKVRFHCNHASSIGYGKKQSGKVR